MTAMRQAVAPQLRIFTENKHEGVEIALHKMSRWIKAATLAA
jgi:hypothetical protein